MGWGGFCCASPTVPTVPMASFVPPSRCIAHASLGVPLSSGTPTDASWDPSRSAQAGTSDWPGSPLGGSWSDVGGPGGGGGLHPSLCHGFQWKLHGLLPCIICPCIIHHTDTSMEVFQVVAGYVGAEREAPEYPIATLLHGNPHGLCKVASHRITRLSFDRGSRRCSPKPCIAMRTQRAMPWHVVISAWPNCCCLVSCTVISARFGGTLG